MKKSNSIRRRNNIFMLAFHLALAYRVEKLKDAQASKVLWDLFAGQARLCNADTNMINSAHNIAKVLMVLSVNEIHETLMVTAQKNELALA